MHAKLVFFRESNVSLARAISDRHSGELGTHPNPVVPTLEAGKDVEVLDKPFRGIRVASGIGPRKTHR